MTHAIANGSAKLRERGQVVKDEMDRPVRVVGVVNLC